MDMESELTFRSSALPKNCFHVFARLKEEKKFCDITLTVGTKCISAHRIVIAAAVPLFHDALCSEEDEIVMPDMNPDVFECLLNYAYTCQLKINMGNVRDLLSGACQLRMDEVRDACFDFLAERLSHENVLNFRGLATKLHYTQLKENSDHYIGEHFIEVCKTEEFLNCPLFYMMELIGNDDLNVDSEEKVFEAVLRWVRASPHERKVNLPDLLKQVRMPLIKPQYLTDMVEREELIKSSLLIRDLIDEARNYNLFPEKRKDICSFSTKTRQSVKTTWATPEIDYKSIYTLDIQQIYTIRHLDLTMPRWSAQAHQYSENCCSVAEMKNKMYFLHTPVVLEYDLSRNQCKFFLNSTMPRHLMGATSLKNKIFVCGGRTKGRTASNAVECFDPENNEWTVLSPLRTARWGPAVVSLGEDIYALGGRDDSCVHNSVERYCLKTGKWRTVSPMLAKRNCPGAAALNGKIYVCGGYTFSSGLQCTATSEVYDPFKNEWNFISPMNTARCVFTLVARREKLYAIAGDDENGQFLNTCEIYDPKSDNWTYGPSIP